MDITQLLIILEIGFCLAVVGAIVGLVWGLGVVAGLA